MNTAIIIPMHSTTTRTLNCIVQDGTRYCEDQEFTKEDGAQMVLIIIGIFAYMFVGMLVGGWLDDNDKPWWISLVVFLIVIPAVWAVITLLN